MPYVVSRTKPREKKIDLIDFLEGLVTMKMLEAPTVFQTTGTRTVYYDYIAAEKSATLRLPEQIHAMKSFYEKNKHLLVDSNKAFNYELQVGIESELRRGGTAKDDIPRIAAEKMAEFGYEYCSIYRTFYLPKRSSKPGHKKWRRIDAPCDELADALRTLKTMFEALMDGCTYHTSAFAYVPHRCPVDAVRKHANNKSNWELKLDFSNFFGSITPEFAYKMLVEVFPFSEMIKYPGGMQAIENCLSLCFLNGGLPQGTPMSPMLTNIIMIAIDQKISNGLRKHAIKSPNTDKTYDFIYTRYADDMTISNRMKFDPKEVIGYVQAVLDMYDAPMKLNQEKTHFGSNAGPNWMLGVMYNQNYEVTVGHRRKKQLKAALANYAMDKRHQYDWALEDLQQLQGELAYCKSVEEEAINQILSKYNMKFNMDIMAEIKADLKSKSR